MRKILGLVALGVMVACGGTLYFCIASLEKRSLQVNKLPASQQFRANHVAAPSLPKKRLSKVSVLPKTEDGAKFQRVMRYAITQQLYQRPLPEIMQAIAQQFLRTPYQAHLLDESNQETLFVSLNAFDCVMFVETVVAMARGVAVQDYSYQTFVDHLRDERYRDAQMKGYCSRLHYFSEWIANNQKRGTVQDMTRYLGGVKLHKQLNFMSQHWYSYPEFVRSDTNHKCVVAMEARLSERVIDYIPQNRIRSLYTQLQPGDIIGVATDINGLDVTHTGLVYRDPNGNIGFIHASPNEVVKISPDLQTYVNEIKHRVGILLARPVDPRQISPANTQRANG